MSNPETTTHDEPIGFDRAEFAPRPEGSATVCSFCRKVVEGEYWQISERIACAACRSGLVRDLEQAQSRRALLRAARSGALAAALGSIAWIIVTKVTGYELGIIAIGIGFAVGKAVRKGSGGVGGPRYQAMAMFLTYSAIALANIPGILEVVKNSQASAPPPVTPPGLLQMIFAWSFLIGFAYAVPFLAGPQNFMGIIIIGIGLYEAWKFTRAVPIPILGPFPLQPGGATRPAEIPRDGS
jgi:hypothetical protein